MVTQDNKKEILKIFVKYLEPNYYDKEILTCEIFWEMEEYYRTVSKEIENVSPKEIRDYLEYLGWKVIFYN